MNLLPVPRHAARSRVISPGQLRVGALLAGVLLVGMFVAAPSSGPAARERGMPPRADAPGAVVDVRGWSAPAADVSPVARATQASSKPSSATPGTTSAAVFVADSLGRDGIPTIALQAYQQAEQWVNRTRPGCGLDWSLLAAIGRVESDHGRFNGATLHPDGTSTPAIIGIALDGTRSAIVRDTDGGRYDGDTSFDHAVGPMQFIPSTWATFAQDGNRDGRADVFNIFDAARGSADYLCSAGGDLTSQAGVERAVLSYNPSPSYLRDVVALAAFYAGHPVTSSAAATPLLSVGPPRRSRRLPPADPAPPPATPTPRVGPSVGTTATSAPSATPRTTTPATRTSAAPSMSATPTADGCSPELTPSATAPTSPRDGTPTSQPDAPESATPTPQPDTPASGEPTPEPDTSASGTPPPTSSATSTAGSMLPTSTSSIAAPSARPSAVCPTDPVKARP